LLRSLRGAALFLSVLTIGALNALPLRAQGKIAGTVTNGTTGKPVASQVVQLMVPRNGMQEVATARTDAAGRFDLSPPAGESAPFFLVQTVFQNVNYRVRITGGSSADLTVYDSTREAPPLRIRSARILVHAEGAKAHVQELFAVENPAQPPRTFSHPDGTFFFHLGEGAGDPTAAVAGQMNMPIPQAVQDGKSPREFYINYALPPGVTVIMVAYDADYSSGRFSLDDRVDYPIGQVELRVSPPTLSVDSSVFKPAGVDSSSGERMLQAENLPSGSALAASLSGEAAAVSAAESGQMEGDIKTVPNSMARLGVPLLACFLLILLWALGVRMAKEWPRWKERQATSPAQKELETKVDELLNSLADLDELFAAGKVPERSYWKERLELKAKIVTVLKNIPPALLDSYATRRAAR
jgi:5-hydroxyisourate hydrolase-like protein (transthyretin family)